MKKISVFTILALAASVFAAAPNFTTSGGAKAAETAPGIYRVEFPAGKGWPQIRFAVPPMQWQGGTVTLSIKQIEPAKAFPGGLTVGTARPGEALKAGYVTTSLKAGEKVKFRFECLGDKTPAELHVAAKNPTAPAVLEITMPVFTAKAAAAKAAKKRLAPVPPVMFKGKPFFPLGAYDTFKIGEAGKFGSMDPGFLEAGGNFTDFGLLYLPPESTTPIYRKVYQSHGQVAIFAALDRIKDDPAWRDVALLVGLGANLMLDESDAAKVGMNNMLKPATGEKLELRKKVLAEAAAKLATYPNVIGYTMDEPENCIWKYYEANYKEDWKKNQDRGLAARMLEWLGWTREVIKKNHPSALMMPIIAWEPNYPTTASLYDVLIANAYPWKLEGKKEFDANLYQVNYDAACQVAAVRAAGGGRSAIFMPPMYDIRQGHIGYTLNEQLYVLFAPLTRGAMGIHGWRLQRCSDAYRKFVIYPAMKEVHKLKEYFLGEWHDELVTSDRDTASVDYLQKFKTRVREVAGEEDGVLESVKDAVPDVTYCLRKHPDGSYLLLAVNNQRAPLSATFTLNLPQLPRFMIDNINKSDKVWLKGNQAQVKFAPFGVHAYIFRP